MTLHPGRCLSHDYSHHIGIDIGRCRPSGSSARWRSVFDGVKLQNYPSPGAVSNELSSLRLHSLKARNSRKDDPDERSNAEVAGTSSRPRWERDLIKSPRCLSLVLCYWLIYLYVSRNSVIKCIFASACLLSDLASAARVPVPACFSGDQLYQARPTITTAKSCISHLTNRIIGLPVLVIHTPFSASLGI